MSKIIEIAKYNPFLAHNYIAVPAFLDFEKLPKAQQALMAEQLKRFQQAEVHPRKQEI